MARYTLLALLSAVALLAGCGGAGSPTGTGSAPPTAGACLSGATDCADVPTGTTAPAAPGSADPSSPFPVEEHRQQARELLGTPEEQLADSVRVARRGGERFALTEDYVIGRMTVELDRRDGTGPFVVTAVTAELPGGPETFKTDQPSR